VLRNRLSHEFTDGQIRKFKEQDDSSLFAGIEIQPDKLTPRTPQEAREDAAAAIQSGMISADDARRNLWLRHNVGINEAETRAFRYQQLEISSMLEGEEAEVDTDQNHAAHKFVISLHTDDPRWFQYDEEQRDRIRTHARDHDAAMLQQAQLAQDIAEPQTFSAQESQISPEQQALSEPQPQNELAGAFPPPSPALQPGGQGLPNEQLPGFAQDLQALTAPNVANDAGLLAGVL